MPRDFRMHPRGLAFAAMLAAGLGLWMAACQWMAVKRAEMAANAVFVARIGDGYRGAQTGVRGKMSDWRAASVIVLEEGARCPVCKMVVRRGVRKSDSWLVAVCGMCGVHPLEGVKQPEPRPLSAEEEAILTTPEQAGPTEEGARWLRRIEKAREKAGMSYAALSRATGQQDWYLGQMRARLMRGEGVNRDRLEMVLSAIEEATRARDAMERAA